MGNKERSIRYQFPRDIKPDLAQAIICAARESPARLDYVIVRKHSGKKHLGRCFPDIRTIVINLDAIKRQHRKRKKQDIPHPERSMVLQTALHEAYHLGDKKKHHKKREKKADKWARKKAKQLTGTCLKDF
jgi:hypothetical protein